MLYRLLKPIIFRTNPENAHEKMLKLGNLAAKKPRLLKWMRHLFHFEDKKLNTRIGNLTFPNPIGLAAGFDKNAEIIPLLEALGFGSLEVGTVTPKGQPGNPSPRLFRLVEDRAIINRMGFNNDGIEALCDKLKNTTRNVPVGVNLGKNKHTPNEDAAEDYCIGLEKAWTLADYFTINISSPNTPNLRDLQSEKELYPLLKAILEKRDRMIALHGEYKQIWLKIAPDLSKEQIKATADIAMDLKLDALILTNTTLHRDGLHSPYQIEAGGLSGKPVREISNLALQTMAEHTNGKIPLIGVGGIFNAQDIITKLELGASMVQVYTGMIYEGPKLIQRLKKDLLTEMEKREIKSLDQLRGTKLK